MNHKRIPTEFPHLEPPGDYTDPFRFQLDPFEENITPMASTFAYATGKKRGRYQISATKKQTVPAATRKYVKTCMKRVADQKHLTVSDGVSVASAGTTGLSIMALSQGTAEGNRVGNQVSVDAFTYRGNITTPAANTGDNVRCILVLDHQPNGAAFGITDVLFSASWIAPYNYDKVSMPGNVQRFTILRDFVVVVNAPSSVVATGTALMDVPFSGKSPTRWSGFSVHYQGNAGTVSDLVKNDLRWLFISATGTASASCQTCVRYVNP